MCLELPSGVKVNDISPYGASYWTRTAEIQTTQPDGSKLSYFLKVSQITEVAGGKRNLGYCPVYSHS